MLSYFVLIKFWSLEVLYLIEIIYLHFSSEFKYFSLVVSNAFLNDLACSITYLFIYSFPLSISLIYSGPTSNQPKRLVRILINLVLSFTLLNLSY